MWVPVPGSSLNLYHPVPTRSDFTKKRGANRGNRVILERKKLLLTKSCFLHDLCFSFFPPREFGSKRSNSDSQKLRKIPALDGLSHLHGLGVVNLIRSTHRDPESQHLRRVGHDFENTMSEEDKEPGWFDDMDEFDWDDASWRHKKIISKSQTKLNSGNMFFHFFWGGGLLIFLPQLQNLNPLGLNQPRASWVGPIGQEPGPHRLNQPDSYGQTGLGGQPPLTLEIFCEFFFLMIRFSIQQKSGRGGGFGTQFINSLT